MTANFTARHFTARRLKTKLLIAVALTVAANGWCGAWPTLSASAPKPSQRFFAFNNCVKDEKYDTPEEQVTMLKELGYDGMEKNGLDDFAAVQSELDRQGLKMYTVYVNVNLDPGPSHYDARLSEVIRSLKGRETMLWLNVTSRGKTFAPSSRDGDETAVKLVREIAAMADDAKIKVMLYPHVRFWLEGVPHAVELVKKINRPNVGLTFNLTHWLAMTSEGEEKNLRPTLEAARPHLFAVSLSGATNNETDKQNRTWNELIQPLGRGTFDTRGLVRTLREMNFDGPVGLQCYSVKGDKRDNLKISMDAWRQH